LIFGTGSLRRGLPPIVEDKENFTGAISQFVDPLPQALILTAIVISFGVTAFVVVLINRRDTLQGESDSQEPRDRAHGTRDPFVDSDHFVSGLDADPDDYEWLEYSLADEYRRQQAEEQSAQEEKEPV
jgi:multicomponent Na+:H+ antiporter subunit C